MKQYLQVLKQVIENGIESDDRTGTGTISIFGTQARFNLLEGFPVPTTRKIYTKGFIEEMLWHIRGSNDISELHRVGVHIWDEWAVKESDIDAFLVKYNGWDLEDNASENPSGLSLAIKNIIKPDIMSKMLNKVGFIYGDSFRSSPCGYSDINKYYPTVELDMFSTDRKNRVQNHIIQTMNENPIGNSDKSIMREIYYRYIDQLNLLIEGLKKRPNSRRHIISTWIPEWLPFENLSPQENVLLGKGALAPCPMTQQYKVIDLGGDKKYLSMVLYIRSNDLALGAAFNIPQYSLLLSMVAQVVDMIPYELIWTVGDAHIYKNHIEGVKEQLTRMPLPLSRLKLNPEIKDIFNFRSNDIEIINYKHHDPIKFDVSV